MSAAVAVAAGAAVVGAGASIMQGREAQDQAQRQYEAQQAAFNNEIEAAIINSEWQLVDNATQYAIDNEQRLSQYSSTIDTVWDRSNAELSRIQGQASIEALETALTSSIDQTRVLSDLQTQAQALYENAIVDMEYTMAMSSAAQDYNSQKAVLEAIQTAAIAQSTVAFLDQDINNIKEQINRVKEEADVQTMEAVGKVIASQAASLTSGNSRARGIMNTMMRADQLKQQKVEEQESALQKAYATQERVASETNAKIEGTYNQAIIQNNRLRQETVSQLTEQLLTTGIQSEEMLSTAGNTLSQIQDMLTNNLTTINNTLGINVDNINQIAAIESDSLTDQFNTTQSAADQNYTASQIQNYRNREQSYITAFEQFTGAERDQALVDYANFTTTTEYRQYVEWAEANGQEYGLAEDRISTFDPAAVVAASQITHNAINGDEALATITDQETTRVWVQDNTTGITQWEDLNEYELSSLSSSHGTYFRD